MYEFNDNAVAQLTLNGVTLEIEQEYNGEFVIISATLENGVYASDEEALAAAGVEDLEEFMDEAQNI